MSYLAQWVFHGLMTNISFARLEILFILLKHIDDPRKMNRDAGLQVHIFHNHESTSRSHVLLI